MGEFHVDEIMRRLQGHLKKITLDRLSSLSVRMGVARRRPVMQLDRSARKMHMTDEPKTPERKEPKPAEMQVIEFYVPANFRKPVRWVPAAQRGKLLQFRPTEKKTA